MLGLVNTPTSVFKSLSLLQMQQGGGGYLGAPGDVYIITDTRKNPRKDLSKMSTFQTFDTRKLNVENLQKMSVDDPLLYEEIKSGLGKLGDKYVITDLRERSKKDLPDIKNISRAKINIEPYSVENSVTESVNESVTSSPNVAMTDGGVKIQVDGNKFVVTSPYSSEFVKVARNYGGKWNGNGWVFVSSEMPDIKKKLLEIYGSDGTLQPAVTLLVKNLSDRSDVNSGYELFNIPIARAYGRDSGARLNSNIILIDGEITSDGSMKHPYTRLKDATFRIKDVPKALISNNIYLANAIKDGWVEVVEFEDNADLMNFFAKSDDKEYSNAQNVDFENVATSTASNSKRGVSRTHRAITTPDTLYLPGSKGSKALPRPANPKSLPPSDAPKQLRPYDEAEDYFDEFVKFEFENNNEIFKTFGSGVSGLTVNDKPAALFNCPEYMLQCKGFTPTYTRLVDYSALIEPATGAKKLVGYGFEVATLNELANACNHYNDVARLASHLKADNVLQSAFNVWHWLHDNIKYNYDTPGEEEIRTPARSWADRENGVDCDCIAVFTACLLGCMGYKPKFEIVAFNNSPKFSHIYVNLDGAAIDRVLPVFLARPENITKTKIMDIPVFELSGTSDGGFSTLNGIYADTLLKVNSGTANAQDSMDLRKTQVLLGLQKSDPQAYKLAAILMPYVVAIDDNGSYYFANDKVAEIAENADKKLYSLKVSGANQAAFDDFFNGIVGEMKNISVRLERGDGKTIVTISFTNPQNDTYNVEGEYVKKDMLAINPDFLTMRNALKNLIAVNYYDLATRFAVGLMTEVNAVQAGYTPETWQKAVEATNKLKKLWTLLGGDVETLIQIIESGADKESVVEVDGDTSIIETSAFDSVLHGCKYNALSGINGLGETSTVNSELDTLGEGFETLLQWVAEIEPGETVNISISKTSDGESNIRYASTMPQNVEKKNKAWLWLLGGAVVGSGIAAATSGKKNKKSKR